MNVGYVRLSRDDDKRNYVSIENQKLIISRYAAERGFTLDGWYEDDGVSGYLFDRPGFCQLMADLDKGIQTVLVKDFSRLGRHNAKVLLLLEAFQERGIHLIVIDDNYDSWEENDDVIGIKTWFNEHYVKDTSKKIKRAIGARQKEGTWKTQPPFAYRRNEKDETVLEAVPEEAECVKRVYDLYLNGYGYRKIAEFLNAQNIPTPSKARHIREIKEGRMTKRSVAADWTDGMVKDLLDNDFYIGTLRLKKRARSTVHGKDRRVPKEEQYVFEKHHPAIIDKAVFDLAQEIKEKRKRNHYRGSREKAGDTTEGFDRGFGMGAEIRPRNPFGSCLFCKDCGKRLTPIRRTTAGGERKYYICTTYNTKGKRYCAKSHLLEERDLLEDVLHYIRGCRDVLGEEIAAYDSINSINSINDKTEKRQTEEKRKSLQRALEEEKRKLRVLLSRKIADLAELSACPQTHFVLSFSEKEKLIQETYDSLQDDLLAHMQGLEQQLQALNDRRPEAQDDKAKAPDALAILDRILAEGELSQRDIELFIERIEVDEKGLPEITLKYGLPGLLGDNVAKEMNRRENETIALAMQLVSEEGRGYISAKYLSEHMTKSGVYKTKRSVLPYLNLMKEMGILEQTENSQKPYAIVKTKEEIEKLREPYLYDLHPLHSAVADRRNAGDGI